LNTFASRAPLLNGVRNKVHRWCATDATVVHETGTIMRVIPETRSASVGKPNEECDRFRCWNEKQSALFENRTTIENVLRRPSE
jgi:hypothetical protein